MLSYRHSFHAGNFADILKHSVLVEILDHLVQKAAPFEYFDSHAGAGLFDLNSDHAQKLEEHVRGIAKLTAADFPELARYFEVIQSFNKTGVFNEAGPLNKAWASNEAGTSNDGGDINEAGALNFYPGSPSIAKYFLRRQDRGWLFELHPQDYQLLHGNMENHKKIRVSREDGLKGVLALLPPTSRRGLILIDPSYEVKTEYDQVFRATVAAYKKFATGIYAVWYPVVDRQKIDDLEKKFVQSGIKNIQRFELGLRADSDEKGMTSSGMFVINPPWKLFDKMAALLPRLAQTLGDVNAPVFKCDTLVKE